MPSVFAKESVLAGTTIENAFLKYFQNQGHLEGSALVKARVEHSQEYNVPSEDIARFECGGALGILTNTSPTTFWMICYIYSNNTILEECRQELAKVTFDTIFEEEGETKTLRTLDMTSVKSACPILLSTLQEVLRTHSIGISARLVMKDCMLDGKYFPRKAAPS